MFQKTTPLTCTTTALPCMSHHNDIPLPWRLLNNANGGASLSDWAVCGFRTQTACATQTSVNTRSVQDSLRRQGTNHERSLNRHDPQGPRSLPHATEQRVKRSPDGSIFHVHWCSRFPPREPTSQYTTTSSSLLSVVNHSFTVPSLLSFSEAAHIELFR